MKFLTLKSTKITNILRKVAVFFKQNGRVALLASRGFFAYKSTMRAASLTYFTMLSMVPILALVFGIAKGFGMERMLQREIMNKLAAQQEVALWVINLAKSIFSKARGEWIAGIGFIILFWAVIRMLNNIENAFNDIWHIKKGRKFSRKLSGYFALIFFAPIFIILSSSATVYLTTHIKTIISSIAFLGFFAPFIKFFISLVPYVLVWALFTMVFMTVPNTKVKFGPAIIAGILSGTMFQLTQWAYLKFQIGVSGYNALYGSLAALPLFMVWVQTGWLIVLFGAEFCYISHNIEQEYTNIRLTELSTNTKRALYLMVTHVVVDKFVKAEKAPSIADIALETKLPNFLITDLIAELVDSGVLIQVYTDSDEEQSFQPAVDPMIITVGFVVEAVNAKGVKNDIVVDALKSKPYEYTVLKMNKAIEKSESNILVKNILL
jgi:membrane protein